jgi:hypothetical protein
MKKKGNKKRHQTWYHKAFNTPWLRNTSAVFGVLLLTLVGYYGQQWSEWLGASLVSVPKCVQDDGAITTFPVPGVVNSLNTTEILKAIGDRKISSLQGKPYSFKEDQLKKSLQNLLTASTLQELTKLEEQEYQDGGHIGIDIPVWWMENKDSVQILNPFKQAEVYKIWKLEDGSGTWGNAVTLCFSNASGTYFAHFAHMRDVPLVNQGQVVTQGTQLGLVGNTGQSYGAHLHFQINKAARYNPYYTSNKSEMISSFVDPLVLTLKQSVALGSVLVAGDTSVNNTSTPPATPPTVNNLIAASIFDISLSPTKTTPEVGEKVTVNINATDKNGAPVDGKVLIASSASVGLPAEKQLTNGVGSIEITSAQAQPIDVIITSADGTVSEKTSISFTEKPKPADEEKGIFTDVSVKTVSGAELDAITYLKDNGITKGNPDGSFGIDNNLNRASAATFLIRAFYPQIDLNSVQIGAMPFNDVPQSEWFASAMYISSLESYKGLNKPVFIKGSNGKANPAGDVKLEELAAMVLRVLKVDVITTEPWYDGYLNKMSQLSLVSQSEASRYLGKAIPRKMVARILHQAILWQQSHPNGLQLTDEEKALVAPTESVVEAENPPSIDPPSSLSVQLNGSNEVVIGWTGSGSPNIGYTIYRQLDSGAFEVLMNKLTTTTYLDSSTVTNRIHTYKIIAENLNTGEVSTATNTASISL